MAEDYDQEQLTKQLEEIRRKRSEQYQRETARAHSPPTHDTDDEPEAGVDAPKLDASPHDHRSGEEGRPPLREVPLHQVDTLDDLVSIEERDFAMAMRLSEEEARAAAPPPECGAQLEDDELFARRLQAELNLGDHADGRPPEQIAAFLQQEEADSRMAHWLAEEEAHEHDQLMERNVAMREEALRARAGMPREFFAEGILAHERETLPSALEVGSRVVLARLVRRPELNGRVGTVLESGPMRMQIALDNDPVALSVLPRNVDLAEEEVTGLPSAHVYDGRGFGVEHSLPHFGPRLSPHMSRRARVREPAMAFDPSTGRHPVRPHTARRLLGLRELTEMSEMNGFRELRSLQHRRDFSSFRPYGEHGHDLDTMSYDALLDLSERIGDAIPQGAREEDIATLPTRMYSASGTEEETCAVCLDSFEDGSELRTLPCFHNFHTGCIDRWLMQKSSCPVCKASINN